jgi:hypothetical protein
MAARCFAKAEFTTIRERLFKTGARAIERAARIRIQLPPVARRARCSAPLALGIMLSAP